MTVHRAPAPEKQEIDLSIPAPPDDEEEILRSVYGDRFVSYTWGRPGTVVLRDAEPSSSAHTASPFDPSRAAAAIGTLIEVLEELRAQLDQAA